MSARLRHIVLAGSSLAAEVAAARDGLGLGAGITDEAGMAGFSLSHEVLCLGSAYLEIVAPVDVTGDSPAARFLARGGPGGYMLDLQVPDLDEVLGRVAGLGLAPVLVDEYRGNRICQLHPRDFGTLLEVEPGHLGFAAARARGEVAGRAGVVRRAQPGLVRQRGAAAADLG
jgi:hypothetical protein